MRKAIAPRLTMIATDQKIDAAMAARVQTTALVILHNLVTKYEQQIWPSPGHNSLDNERDYCSDDDGLSKVSSLKFF